MYLRPKNKKEIWGGTQQGPIPLMLCHRLPVLVLVWGLVVMSRRPHQHKMRQINQQVKSPVLDLRLIRRKSHVSLGPSTQVPDDDLDTEEEDEKEQLTVV
jgi:hypothetical protein